MGLCIGGALVPGFVLFEVVLAARSAFTASHAVRLLMFLAVGETLLDLLYLTQTRFATNGYGQACVTFLVLPVFGYALALLNVRVNWDRLFAALWFEDAAMGESFRYAALLAAVAGGGGSIGGVYSHVSPRVILQRGGSRQLKVGECCGQIWWAIAAPPLALLGSAIAGCREKVATAAAGDNGVAQRMLHNLSLKLVLIPCAELVMACTALCAATLFLCRLTFHLAFMGPLLWRADALSLPSMAHRFFMWDEAQGPTSRLTDSELSFLFTSRLCVLAAFQSMPQLILQ